MPLRYQILQIIFISAATCAAIGCASTDDLARNTRTLTPGEAVDIALSGIGVDQEMFMTMSVEAIRMEHGWMVMCDATDKSGTRSSFAALVGLDGKVSNVESHATPPN